MKTIAVSILLVLSMAICQGGAIHFTCEPVCQDATVNISSDLLDEGNYTTGANVLVTPHPLWATPPVGASWISAGYTGYNQNYPANSTVTPIFVFWEAFFLPGGFNTGSLRVWADDTAALYLDGNQVGPAPNFSQGTCAVGPLGCEQDEYVDISLDGLSQGAHLFEVGLFQVGGSPTGLLYSGSIESLCAETPEPQTIALMGVGLIG